MTQQFDEYGVSVGVVAVFRFSANKALGDLHAKFDEHFKFADYLLVPRVLHRILRELPNGLHKGRRGSGVPANESERS